MWELTWFMLYLFSWSFSSILFSKSSNSLDILIPSGNANFELQMLSSISESEFPLNGNLFSYHNV